MKEQSMRDSVHKATDRGLSRPSAPAVRNARFGKTTMRGLGLIAVALITACDVEPSASIPQVEPSRNLLIICIDTLRADHIGSYGYHRPTTPRIDSLASKGTLFLDARAHSSYTVPSTASLLTSSLERSRMSARTTSRSRYEKTYKPWVRSSRRLASVQRFSPGMFI